MKDRACGYGGARAVERPEDGRHPGQEAGGEQAPRDAGTPAATRQAAKQRGQQQRERRLVVRGGHREQQADPRGGDRTSVAQGDDHSSHQAATSGSSVASLIAELPYAATPGKKKKSAAAQRPAVRSCSEAAVKNTRHTREQERGLSDRPRGPFGRTEHAEARRQQVLVPGMCTSRSGRPPREDRVGVGEAGDRAVAVGDVAGRDGVRDLVAPGEAAREIRRRAERERRRAHEQDGCDARRGPGAAGH